MKKLLILALLPLHLIAASYHCPAIINCSDIYQNCTFDGQGVPLFTVKVMLPIEHADTFTFVQARIYPGLYNGCEYVDKYNVYIRYEEQGFTKNYAADTTSAAWVNEIGNYYHCNGGLDPSYCPIIFNPQY